MILPKDNSQVAMLAATMQNKYLQGYVPGQQLTASANLSATDNGTLIDANHATVAIALTILNDATVPWDSNTIIAAYQRGAAAVSFVAGAGVTIHTGNGIPTPAQYGLIGIMRVGANEWTTF